MKKNAVLLAVTALLFAFGCAKFDPVSSPPNPPPSSGSQESRILGRVTADATGIANVIVSLTGPVSNNVGTDVNGNYSFTGLSIGSYTVSIFNPNPGIYEFGSLSRSVQVQNLGSTYYVTEFSGTRKSSASPNLATIVGLAWLDANANGRYDSGEFLFSGATIFMTGSLSRQTSTGSDGRYAFTGLSAGSYNIGVSNPNTASYLFDSERTGWVVGINDANGTVFIVDFRAIRR